MQIINKHSLTVLEVTSRERGEEFKGAEWVELQSYVSALRAERDELLDELKWAWDNLAKSEPYPDEECEYDRCTVCRCPDWKHSETCQLKEREAVARAILAKYSGKEK